MARPPVMVPVADFEEGVAGTPANGGFAGPPMDPGDLSFTSPGVYDAESHTGSLSARIGPSTMSCVLATGANNPRVTGGGGWFKIKTAPSADSGVANVQLYDESSVIHGVLLRAHLGNLTAYDEITDLSVGSVALPMDQWLEVQLDQDGTWSVSNSGGVLMSGTVVAPSGLIAQYAWQALARDSAVVLVDDLWVWAPPVGPVTRLYPRDDGRGMSSAPRIYPTPRGRSRIIGGFQ